MRFVCNVLVVTVLLFAVCLAASAQVRAQRPPASIPAILAEQSDIRADLRAGVDKYRHVDPLRRRKIDEAQAKVFALLEGHQSLSELDADDQLTVFNALKTIESHLVMRNEDERMVCERVAVVGTRRFQVACMTESERRRRADQAKDSLMRRPVCQTGTCRGG
jgi:hypothetical protein